MPDLLQPWAIDTDSTEASVARRAQALTLGGPLASFAGGISPTTHGGAHGVAGTGDLAVSQHAGTPGMSVDVAVGMASVLGTSAADQGAYAVSNAVVKTVTISAAHATLARKDLIVARIYDNPLDSSGDTKATVEVVTGTASGSPADPTIPAGSLVLARVTVAAAASSIVNANIADLRTYAAALGGVRRCTSATRPTGVGLILGLIIFETDTLLLKRWDGSAWGWSSDYNAGEIRNAVVLQARGKKYTANVSGAVTIDAANGPEQVLTITGNVTSLAVANFNDMESVFVAWIMDGTGHTFAGLTGTWLWPGGGTAATAGFKITANAVNDMQIKKVGSLYHAFLGNDMKV